MSAYAHSMVNMARILGSRLSVQLGEPIFGATESHLLLFDVSQMMEGGLAAEESLERGRILVNRNLLPGDARSPWSPSGIRLGTGAIAILDYADHDVESLGDAICSILQGSEDHSEIVARLLETYHRPLVNISNGANRLAPT